MADEQTLPLSPAQQTNGFHSDMSDEDLLTALSMETVQPSYGYVRLRFTHGDVETTKRLKVQPVDIFGISRMITEEMASETKAHILHETQHARSVAYNDESWLQYLAALCHGLCPPMVITDPQTKKIVWRAGGEPQDLPGAMIALCRLGFTYWHIEEVVSKIGALTRMQNQAGSEGNS